MRKSIDIKRVRLFLWIGLAFFLMDYFADVAQHETQFLQRAVNNIWSVVYVTCLNYFLFEYAFPQFGWKRIGKSFLLLVAFIFLYSAGILIWTHIGIGLHLFTLEVVVDAPKEPMQELVAYSIGSAFFFGIVRHIYVYVKLKQSAQQLRIEKQQAELNYLKSQTNPHFLFNTLNNIYSLSRDKSDLAPESILRLSKILRYMLYETGGAFIAIEQDLQIIEDYIALERYETGHPSIFIDPARRKCVQTWYIGDAKSTLCRCACNREEPTLDLCG
jgi:two-component system, LytTR family, sensor kinase